MRKKLVILGLIVVAGIILLGIVKDSLIKSVVTAGTTKVIGAPVKIDGFSLSVFKQAVRIKGFRIYNPKGYPKEPFLDISEVSVDYDLGALLKRKLHLPSVVVNLNELVVIKNKEGKLNVDSLKVAQQKEEPSKPKERKPSEQMPMQIDIFTLSIGKVIYKDFSVGDKPSIQVYDIGIKEKTYQNITSVQQLALLILEEPMKKTAIKGAGIYGAAAVLGVGFLPVGVAGALIGKDSSQIDFDVDYDKVFNTSAKVMREMGKSGQEDKTTGIVKGKVSGCNVTIKIVKKTDKTVQVTVSARKYLIPKPQIAGGVLHQISEELK